VSGADLATRRSERGSSLFEVTLAVGLMAGVLGSVAGLFVLGAGGVRSGRNASAALAVARSMVEEMQGWGVRQIPQALGCDVSGDSCLADSATDTELAAWQALLDEQLPDAHVTIALTPLEPDAPPLKNSWQMRVIVTVHWDEGERHRRVRLGTVRI
jgi:hypothetical protein